MKILQRKVQANTTKSNYSKVAWFYDAWSKITEAKAARKVLELAAITDGMQILEVACGTGIFFEKIVKQNPNGKNLGFDLSADMLALAKKRMEKGNYSNYELKEKNVLQMDITDDSFDLIVNNFMVDLMPEELFDSLAETFYRLLKPGGALVISTFSFGTRPVHKIWYFIAKAFPALLTGCRPIRFGPHLAKAGFTLEAELELSQNTFPSQIIKAVKK